MTITVDGVRAELRADSPNVATATPRLSWTVDGPDGWRPTWAEARLDGGATVRLPADSVLAPWPFAPLVARQQATVEVRVGDDAAARSDWSEPAVVFGAFLDPGEWRAQFIRLPDDDAGSTPALLRRDFDVSPGLRRATLYATARGVYQSFVNGQAVDDHVLKPGWTAYQFRLLHETTDVTALVRPGRNTLGVTLAGGWHTEAFMSRAAFYGEVPSVAAQLRLDYEDGAHAWVVSDAGWRATTGPITASGIYAGEDYDARREHPGWSTTDFDESGWTAARVDNGTDVIPVAQVGPPVRRTEEIGVVDEFESAAGGTIFDFGQNLVGRLRIAVTLPAGTRLTLRHAEVVENGELGTRPLRGARATDTYVARGGEREVWEPEFTFHGFRYAQITGADIPARDVTAVVVGSDMARTGWFSSSDPLLNRLHENVVWGMRGNFLAVPTDCPQRDERLGWTGDLQVFAPTASFLYDTRGFLTSWLDDLDLEQRAAGGLVPYVIPDPLSDAKRPVAAWGDAATVVPTVLYERYADVDILRRQLPSMKAWTDVLLDRAGAALLWRGDFQFGDWLDPAAPPENPFSARTDPDLVATAYLQRSAALVARAAEIVGDRALAETYDDIARRVQAAFEREYVTPSGRVSSDSPTAYALALHFGLYSTAEQRRGMGERLADLVRRDGYRIATGFVGTPIIADALTATGHLRAAGRLLFQTENPSWLYPVTMGATTIWERWDSMLEDGTINPGEMTSFNHYALGSVADWLHRVVAGLAPEQPGYRVIRIAPRPLSRLTEASAEHDSPYGRVRVAWRRDGATVVVDARVPTGASAVVDLPGADPFTVQSGEHHWEFEAPADDAPRARLDSTTPLPALIDDEEAYDALRAELEAIDPDVAARLRRQVGWSPGFTADGILHALPPGGRERVQARFDELNRRAR